jgi:hypothetical protein
MPLIRYGDKLLRNPDGSLACSLDDCCDAPPPTPCPDCCIRITSGALIGGEIKIFASWGDRSIEITIITPSGTRIVCDGDVIEIFVRYYDGEELVTVPFDAEISWDALWTKTDDSPEPDLEWNGIGGFVAWEDVELTVGGQEYLYVALEMNECLLVNNENLFGLISVTVDDITELIASEPCDPFGDCCIYEFECEPCCLALAYDGINPRILARILTWNEALGRFEKIAVVEDEPNLSFYVVLWVKPAADADPLKLPLWCYDPEEVWEFGVEIHPGNAASFGPHEQIGVTVDFCEFELVQDSVVPAWGTVDGTTIEWLPPEFPDRPPTYSFSWALTRNCQFPGCNTIQVFIGIGETPLFMEVGLTECDNPGDVACFPCQEIYGNGDGCCEPMSTQMRVSWTCGDEEYSVVLNNNRNPEVFPCPVEWWYPGPGSTESLCTSPPPDPLPPNKIPYYTTVGFPQECSETCGSLCKMTLSKNTATTWNLQWFTIEGGAISNSVQIANSTCEMPIEFVFCGVTFTVTEEGV